MAPLPSRGLAKTGTPADAIERARHLRLQAEVIVARAAAVVGECAQQRSSRRRWFSLWKACYPAPDHFLVCCAYCTRIRTLDGDWVPAPTLLRGTRSVDISHGACQDCLAQQFPQWPSLSAPEAAVRGRILKPIS